MWIEISRKTIVDNLHKNYKINKDYFIITQKEEKEIIVLNKNLMFKPNQLFIKITSQCFKDICIRSHSKKGALMRKYCMDLDELFKKFHLEKIQHISNENDTLLNNQSKNKLKKDGGLYIWTNKINSGEFRIGYATDVYERINIHNSSNKNKIYPLVIIYSKYFIELEYLLKIALQKNLYRGEFYNCELKKLNYILDDIINFLNKYIDGCNIKKKILNILFIKKIQLLKKK